MVVSLAVPLFFLLLLIFLAAVIALLANRHTRPIVLGLGAVLALLAVFAMLAYRTTLRPVEGPRIVVQKAVPSPQTAPAVPGRSAPQPVAPPSVAPVAPPPAIVPPSVPTKKQEGLLTALARAVRQTLAPKDVSATATVTKKPAAESPLPPAAPARPAWIDAKPQNVGDAYWMSVSVGPYSEPWECEANLPDAVQAATREYVELRFGPEAAGRVDLPGRELTRELVRERYEENVSTSLGPMTQLHARLAFDVKMQEKLQQAWQQSIVAERLVWAGVILGGILALLAAVYGLLRLTETSDGQPRGLSSRQLHVALLVLAVLALVGWLLVSS